MEKGGEGDKADESALPPQSGINRECDLFFLCLCGIPFFGGVADGGNGWSKFIDHKATNKLETLLDQHRIVSETIVEGKHR